MKECPDTHVSFRINIDKESADDYYEVHNLLKNNLPRNHSIYPGILRANKGCESENFFSSHDHIEFNKAQRHKGIPLSAFPTTCSKGCCATKPYATVIGPKGETYRCWEHIGHPNLETGNISHPKLSNPDLFRAFIMHGHNLNDKKCLDCGFLPICQGGCPNKRVDNYLNKSQHDLCTLYHDIEGTAITDLLYEYYLSTIST